MRLWEVECADANVCGGNVPPLLVESVGQEKCNDQIVRVTFRILLLPILYANIQ